MEECVNTIFKIDEWLVILGEPLLSKAEVAFLNTFAQECYENICDIFKWLLAVLARRQRDAGDCYSVNTGVLQDIADMNSCEYNPDIIDDGVSYIIGIGGGACGC